MADARQVARQEQVLAEAQKKLERIEKMRQQMIAQVEKEMQHLEKLREVQEDFTRSPEIEPRLGASSPTPFQSQFDQFNTTKSNDRLSTIGNEGVGLGVGQTEHVQPASKQGSMRTNIDFTGKLQTPAKDTPYYRNGDRDQHWTSLMDNPGQPVYVSGRYVSSEHGNHAISAQGEYEYELSSRALPVSVGDILRAPVHPTGHGDGRAFTTSYLQYMVTDIYSTPKFNRYHDRIEG